MMDVREIDPFGDTIATINALAAKQQVEADAGPCRRCRQMLQAQQLVELERAMAAARVTA